MSRARLAIVTTVPETLHAILREQPRFLSAHYDVTLVSSPGRDSADVAANEGVPLLAVPMVRGINPLADVLSVVRMVLLLRRLRPDAVHSYTPKAGLVAMLAAWLCRVPVRIHTFTGLIFPTQSGFRQRLLVWVDRLVCACATCVVPEGEGVKRDLLQFGITGKPLHVIGHGNIAGVDTAYFSVQADGVATAAAALVTQCGIGPDDLVFCFIGRLNRDKGVAELAEAFAALPPRAHLLLVGGLDETAPIDTSTAAALAAHPRIHALGFQPDVRPALHCAHVLVLPSYREGFPNVLLQAGAMARPVVATDISGCNEFVQPGINGWLVPPRDSVALRITLEAVLAQTPARLAAMGDAGRARVLERYERRAHWSRLQAFYDSRLFPRGRRVVE